VSCYVTGQGIVAGVESLASVAGCFRSGAQSVLRTAVVRPFRLLSESRLPANGQKQLVVHRLVGPGRYASVTARHTGRRCCVRRSARRLYGLYFFASLGEVDLPVAVSGRPTMFCSAIRAEALSIAPRSAGEYCWRMSRKARVL
jgi:hypothetical protein